MKKIINILSGFTLSEIMIAMTIIGIISVITVPSMIASVKNHEYKTGVKKAHTIVTESFDSMKLEENDIYKKFNNDNVPATAFRNTYAQYFGMKSVLTPGYFEDKYYPLNDTTTHINSEVYNGGGFLARNGMMIMVGRVDVPNSDEKALLVSVDINGPKRGNNQFGLDVYSFQVLPSDNVLPVGANPKKNGGLSEYSTSFKYEDYCKTDTSGNNLNGIACTYSAVNTAQYMDALGDRGGVCAQNCDGKWLNGECLCRKGKAWNAKECLCECPAGYTLGTDDYCIPRGRANCRLTTNGEKCSVCGDQEFRDGVNGEDWYCINGADCNAATKQCATCPDGRIEYYAGCCPQGVGELDGEGNCDCSPLGLEWGKDANNTDNWSCIAKCPSEQKRVDGLCVCSNENKVNVNGECCYKELEVNGGEKGFATLSADATSCDDYDCGEGKFNGQAYSPRCDCGKGAEWENKKCICEKKHFVYNGASCVCEDGRNNKDDVNECVCNNGSLQEDCACDAAKGLIASSEKGKCQCNTSKGFGETIGADGLCRCLAQNSILENGECVCDASKGYTRAKSGSSDKFSCVCDASKHYVDRIGACVCAAGYEQIDGECVCNGQENSDGTCTQTCKNGATWNKATQKCECNDVKYATLSADGFSCECRISGTYVPEGGKECKCASDFKAVYENGALIQCNFGGSSCDGLGQAFVKGACVCMDGTLDSSGGGCECPEGYTSQEGELWGTVTLTDGSTGASYQQLICSNDACGDFFGTWNSSGGVNGTCDCMEGMSWNGSSCGCMGSNVEYNADYTPPEESSDAPSVYCQCTNSQMTYSKVEGSSNYACNLENGTYNISDEMTLQEASALAGNFNFNLKSNVTVDGDWKPWGTQAEPFTGTFNGEGNTISLEKEITSTDDYVGFFGYTGEGCKISNVNIVLSGVSGKAFVGGLVGHNECVIDNVTITVYGSVTGDSTVGGLVGENNGSIEKCSIEGTTVISKSITGGFAGKNTGTIRECGVKNGVVGDGEDVVGGFVGENTNYIEKSTVDATTKVGKNVIGENAQGNVIGGFAGKQSLGTAQIAYCYSKAEYIRGYGKVGGFLGSFEGGALTESYSTTAKSGVSAYDNNFPSGAFIGVLAPALGESLKVQACFYNNDGDINVRKIGQENGIDLGANALFGYATSGLQDIKNYICAGWGDAKDVWYYPTGAFPEIVDKTNCPTPDSFPKEVNGEMKCLVCGFEEYFTGEDCKALSSYKFSENYNECILNTKDCDAGMHYNAEIDDCVSCDEKKEWNSTTNKCECPTGLIEDGSTCKCENTNAIYTSDSDKTGTTSAEPVCVVCGTGATPDGGKLNCVCANAGETYDYDLRECIPRCTDENFIYENGVCNSPSELVSWDYENNKIICNSKPIIITGNKKGEESSESYFKMSDSIDFVMLGRCANDDVNFPNWTRGKSFVVQNDINMYGIDYTPVKLFEGTLDGKSKIISYLTINKPTLDNVGLLGSVSNANAAVTIQNVHLRNVSITGKNNVGALIGNLNKTGTTLTFGANNLISGSVTGAENVGGLIGYANWGSMGSLSNLNNVGASGSNIAINLTGNYAGGFVGYLNNTAKLTLYRQKIYTTINGSETGNCSGVGKAGVIGYYTTNGNLTVRDTNNTYKNVSNMSPLYCSAP